MLDRVFGGSAEQLLTHLVADRHLSADELKRLRALMDDQSSEGGNHDPAAHGVRRRRRMRAHGDGRRCSTARPRPAAAAAWDLGGGARRHVLLTMAVPWRSRGPRLPPRFLHGSVRDGPHARPARWTRRSFPHRFRWLGRVRWHVDELERRRAGSNQLMDAAWALGSVSVMVSLCRRPVVLSRRRQNWRETDVGVSADPRLVNRRPGRRRRLDAANCRACVDARPRSAGGRSDAQHEREHQRARDPLLLHAAAVGALVMPWNPAVWWMLSRLKLAVEMDCDARVFARDGPADRCRRLRRSAADGRRSPIADTCVCRARHARARVDAQEEDRCHVSQSNAVVRPTSRHCMGHGPRPADGRPAPACAQIEGAAAGVLRRRSAAAVSGGPADEGSTAVRRRRSGLRNREWRVGARADQTTGSDLPAGRHAGEDRRARSSCPGSSRPTVCSIKSASPSPSTPFMASIRRRSTRRTSGSSSPA